MKNLIILLMAFILISSCRSVQKMVDEGRYDEAITYSIKKLKGKKNKKSKYVKGIEKAYLKITNKDLNSIAFLQKRKKGNYWVEINKIAHRIDKRQKRIDPLLPLISKDGYKANFKFIRIEPIIIESENGAAEYYYTSSLRLIKEAENGKKDSARKAYKQLQNIKKYKYNYKNTNELISKVYNLGQKRVLINLINRSDIILPKRFFNEIKDINTSKLNSKWVKFYTNEDDIDFNYDYNIDLTINNIDISPEKETVREFEESKEIKDGFSYLLDEKGNVVKDTLGNDIKEDKYKTIKALVIELYRYKSALVRGNVKIKNLNKNKIYRSVPINVEAVFDSYASRYEGNRKALSKKTKNKLRKYPENFPSNAELLMLAVDDLKNILLKELKGNLN